MEIFIPLTPKERLLINSNTEIQNLINRLDCDIIPSPQAVINHTIHSNVIKIFKPQKQ